MHRECTAERRSPRMKKPWWRKQNSHWYVKHLGKQVCLSKDQPDPDGGTRKDPPAHVVRAWHELEGQTAERRYREMTVKEVFDPFKKMFEHEVKPNTSWILDR